MKDKGINLLKSYKDFDCEIVTDLSRENLLLKLPEFDGITLRRGKIDREILSKCDKLKVIAITLSLSHLLKISLSILPLLRVIPSNSGNFNKRFSLDRSVTISQSKSL